MATPIAGTARRFPWLRTALLLLLCAAFALRMVGLASWTTGIYHDEAYYGLDALAVLQGDLQLYFPANNGREPLFVYLVAAAISALGPSILALRLPAAMLSTAAVAAAFALGARLYGRRIGLATAALMALAPWPVVLGRVGFRAGSLALVLPLAVVATLRGLAVGDRRWLAFGGALAGLCLYTYTAARALPLLAALAWAGWLLRQGDRRAALRRIALWGGAAFLVALPLLARFALDPAGSLGRPGQVSVLSPGIHQGDLAGSLARNIGGTLGMVVWRGDFIPRHNLPGRPVLGLLGAGLWLLGLARMLRRRRTADGLVGAWLLTMSLPTLLAEKAPHFLRAAGLLPALLLPVGLGAEALAARVGRVRGGRAGPLAFTLLIGVVGAAELAATLRYIGRPDPDRYQAFEGPATELALAIAALPLDTRIGEKPARRVWLDRRLRDGWAALPYLVDTEALTLVDPYDPLFGTGPGVAFLMPFALEPEHLWSEHPPGLRFAFGDGPAARGDLEAEARTLFVRVDASPVEPVATPLARFANGLVLVSGSGRILPDAGNGEEALEVLTEWEAQAPLPEGLRVFTHVLDAAGEVRAAQDAAPGHAVLPPSAWRSGDRIADRRRLSVPEGYDPARHRLIVGVYVLPSVERVPRVDAAGSEPIDHVPLPVE